MTERGVKVDEEDEESKPLNELRKNYFDFSREKLK